MTTKDTAVFVQTAKTSLALCTAAKTTYSDTANAVLLFTGGADGDELIGLTAIPRATITATQLQVYLSKDAGVTLSLLTTELMPAYTMAQTTKVTPTTFNHPANGLPISPSNSLRLAGGATPDRLYVAIGVALAGGVQFTAIGGSY